MTRALAFGVLGALAVLIGGALYGYVQSPANTLDAVVVVAAVVLVAVLIGAMIALEATRQKGAD